jgi:S1-C subfamily serine protease
MRRLGTWVRGALWVWGSCIVWAKDQPSAQTLQQTFADIYGSHCNVVCRVSSVGEDQSEVVGSGAFTSDRGHLVTTASTAQGGHHYKIDYNGRTYDAQLIGRDEITNIALLQLKDRALPEGAGSLFLSANRPLPEITSFVCSLSYRLCFNITPTLGYVEGHDVSYFDKLWPTTLLRTNLKMDGGDGGGVVFDLYGNVVGMLAYSLKDVQQGSYVVPTRVLAKVCNEILLFGRVRYGYVGVEMQAVYDNVTGQMRQIITGIDENSPASVAGMRVGDVLVTFDGQSINFLSDLVNYSFFTYPNQKVELEFLRNEKPCWATVSIGEKQ